MKSFNVIFILLLNFLQCHVLQAQQKKLLLDYLSVKDGLVDGTVRAVAQDKFHQMWFGTPYGLDRYDGSNFRHYFCNPQKMHSLSNNMVETIFEDRNGVLWIGTSFGLNRYNRDLDNFDVYYLKRPEMSMHQSNGVVSIAEDDQGILWVGTSHAGVFRFVDSLNRFVPLPDPASRSTETANQVSFNSLVNMPGMHAMVYATFDGIRYVNTRTLQIWSWHNNPKQLSLLVKDSVNAICRDKNNLLWYNGTDGKSILTYDFKANRVTCIKGLDDALVWKQNYHFRKLFCDGQNNLWEGGWQSKPLFIDGKTRRVTPLEVNKSNTRSLHTNMVYDITQDHEGTIWLGTSIGVYKFNPINQPFEIFPLFANNSSLEMEASFTVTDFASDENNRYWIVSSDWSLRNFNPEDGRLNVIYFPDKFKSDNDQMNTIACLDHKIWIGTRNYVVIYDPATQTFHPHPAVCRYLRQQGIQGIKFIFRDSRGTVWIGTGNGGVIRYRGQDGKITRFAHNPSDSSSLGSNWAACIFEDRNQNIWIGCNQGGLNLFLDETENFKVYRSALDDKTKMNSNIVNAISQDKQGHLWLGTYGGGLCRFNSSTGEFQSWTQADGLPDNYCFGAVEDMSGGRWILCHKGIARFNSENASISRMDIDLGLEWNYFEGSWRQERGGKLVYAISNYLIRIDPALRPVDPYEPLITLNQLKIFDKEIPLTWNQDKVKLAYKENFFSIKFNALSYVLPEKIRYAYMLDGFDQNWNYCGNRNFANYTNVPGGHYLLKIKAANASGIWTRNPYTVEIEITPPFYRTWWFYCLTFFAVAGTLYAFYLYRIGLVRKEEKLRLSVMVKTQEEERRRMARDLHDDVGAQLSTVKLFISSLEKERQSATAETLRKNSLAIINSSINDIREILVNLSPKSLDEHGYIAATEELVNKINQSNYIKFDLRIYGITGRFRHDLETALFRITQELINNTIKHAEASLIFLEILVRDGKLFLIYEDNGKGFDADKAIQGYGIKNINTRTTLLNGYMHMDTGPGEGTRVQIEIPFVTARETII